MVTDGVSPSEKEHLEAVVHNKNYQELLKYQKQQKKAISFEQSLSPMRSKNEPQVVP